MVRKWSMRTPLSHLLLALIGIFFFLENSAEPAGQELHFEQNFGRESLHGRLITARELSIWASARNLELIPDCPGRGLEDWEAEIIEPEGISFELDLPGRGRAWLHLDLVSYYPAGKVEPEDLRRFCSLEGETIPFSGEVRYDLPQVRWLDVEINGKRVKTIYMGGGGFPRPPIRILIERELAPERRIHVRLRPSPGETLFAIWDAWSSSDRPEY